MAACLPANASAEAATQRLRGWHRAAEQHWGGAQAADLLPGGGAELVLTYHANLAEVIWNPQGKMAVLQKTAGGWRVAFESPDPTTETSAGRQTLAGNWSFHPAAIGDVTGDGLADLLVEQRWSNGTHAYFSFTKLLTADSAGSEVLRAIYLEDGSRTNPRYRVAGQAVESIISIDNTDEPWLPRDMALAANGDLWLAGVYQLLRLGQRRSLAYPYLVTSLLVAPDDSLWAAGWNGIAESNCCYYHVDGDEVTEYDRSEPLPVSAELEQQIRGLR